MEKENVNEVQRRWRNEFGTLPPTQMQQLHGYVVSSGLMEQCKMWTRYGLKTSQFNWQRKCWNSVTGLHTLPMKSVWQCCYEIVVCKTSVYHILQSEKMDKVKSSVEYPPRSPHLTQLAFYLWDDLKNTVCTRKPRTLQGLRYEIKIASFAVPLREIRHAVAHWDWWWPFWMFMSLR
jgi:hypothetical protein